MTSSENGTLLLSLRPILTYRYMIESLTNLFQGNAIYDSVQSAITIHGTHKSLTDENIIWDPRSVGIYTEDGNEMNNMISNNVVICPDIHRCKWANGNDWQSYS